MEDIEVIYELEKLLGVKSQEVAVWSKQNFYRNDINYVIANDKVAKVYSPFILQYCRTIENVRRLMLGVRNFYPVMSQAW